MNEFGGGSVWGERQEIIAEYERSGLTQAEFMERDQPGEFEELFKVSLELNEVLHATCRYHIRNHSRVVTVVTKVRKVRNSLD